jgi:hypothetical protein
VNVRGVVVSGVAVELCGQVERENLISGGGTVEVVCGVGVIVTLGVAVGSLTVLGVKLRGARLLGVRGLGPAGAEPPGKTGRSGATCGWNVPCCRVGPAVAGAAPAPDGMALSRLSRLSRICS